MIYDLQKANIWKRISAYLCDVILIGIVAVGMAFLLSMILGYDTYTERMDASYAEYEEKFGVSFDISEQDFAALSDAEKAIYEEAWAALASDEEFSRTYSMAISLTVVILTFSILLAYLLLEFFVRSALPLCSASRSKRVQRRQLVKGRTCLPPSPRRGYIPSLKSLLWALTL